MQKSTIRSLNYDVIKYRHCKLCTAADSWICHLYRNKKLYENDTTLLLEKIRCKLRGKEFTTSQFSSGINVANLWFYRSKVKMPSGTFCIVSEEKTKKEIFANGSNVGLRSSHFFYWINLLTYTYRVVKNRDLRLNYSLTCFRIQKISSGHLPILCMQTIWLRIPRHVLTCISLITSNLYMVMLNLLFFLPLFITILLSKS